MTPIRWLVMLLFVGASTTGCVLENDEEVGDMPDDPPACADDGDCGEGQSCIDGACVAACICPAVYAPVCDTEGVTHNNRCEADCAVVEVAYEGECRDEPGECAPEDCGDRPDVAACPDGNAPEMACARTADGACGWEIAECEPDPCACPDVYEPVCGVDGQTYGNACEARCAGVEIASEGECGPRECRPADCGPRPDEAVCPDGQPAPAECAPTADGECGWQIGECPPPRECRPADCGPAPEVPTVECEDGSMGGPICGRDDAGECGWTIRECPGECVCPDVWEPVCGADGQTYGNACEARCAGVEVASEGECGGPNECRPDACGPPPFLLPVCPDGTPPPQECLPGPDGECRWQIGECPPVEECRPEECGPAPGAPNFECPDGSVGGPVCERADDGVCGWNFRQCPDECICPDVWAPVCGEDGNTYGNECEARCAGVNIVADGECGGGPNMCGERDCGPPPFLVAPCPDGNPPEFECVPDADGVCRWRIGECAPVECADDACGPPPRVEPCPDGQVPPMECAPAADGACGWQVGLCGVFCDCPAIFAPVCGADGNTYDNECAARCQGVEVVADGPCEDPGECAFEDCGPPPPVAPCPDGNGPSMECVPQADGQCGWEIGICEEPCLCPAVWAPVCGADGNTYGNACEARCAGVDVVADGECEGPNMCNERDCGPPPFLVAPCPDGQQPELECRPDANGECSWQIGECAPVECGFEDCGPPPPVAPCPDGNGPSVECVPQADGVCGWEIGICDEPCLCLDVWMPVCGADGNTYGNACEARCAGVEIVADGECEGPNACAERDCGPPPFLVALCPDGNPPEFECVSDADGVCRWRIGECAPVECGPEACGPPPPVAPCPDGNGPTVECAPDANGQCIWEIGQCEEICACPDIWAPVCGADGNTYGNACEARCAGVEVAADGECRENACALPPEPGPCEAAMRRWYYDAESGRCDVFIYGGCQGNANNFETEEECAAACMPDEPGACEPRECGPAPGAPNFECPDGSIGGPVCERAADGVCGWNFRECPPVECNCFALWDPVCGVDGETYGNACEADCAGVRVDYEGECRAEPVCGADQCGPAPRPALCEDGQAPEQTCEPDANGRCGWVTECPGAR